MTTTEQMISNATDNRFLYGSFSSVADEAVFYGAVISGTYLVYDGSTGEPIGGTVTGIQLQTRTEHNVLEVHGAYSDLTVDVGQLKNAFQTAETEWYDPAQFFTPALIETNIVSNREGGNNDETLLGSDLSDTLDGPGVDDVIDGGTDIINGNDADDLNGGSGHDPLVGGKGADLFVPQIPGAGGRIGVQDFNLGDDALYLDTGDVLTQPELFEIFSAGAQQDGRDVVYEDHAGNNITPLKTDLDEITQEDFYDIDTEAEEEIVLLGFL